MRSALSPQRFARAVPSIAVLATSYWRACAVAVSDDATAQDDAVLQLVRLGNAPRLRALVNGKARQIWPQEGDEPLNETGSVDYTLCRRRLDRYGRRLPVVSAS